MDPKKAYLSYVTQMGDDRLLWLTDYIQRQPQFLEKHIHPVQLASIKDKTGHVIVADFPRNPDLSMTIHEQSADVSELASWLSSRPLEVHGRLVLVSSTSGINQPHIQTWLKAAKSSENVTFSDAIVLTCPRKAGQPGSHPIKGHVSRSLDPDALGCVAGLTWPEPDLLLQFLDENKHLTFRSNVERFLRVGIQRTSVQHWGDFQVAVDQDNYITVALNQETKDSPWTMIILASEDNCLGLDMNETASPYMQPLLVSIKTPSECFVEALHRLATMQEQRRLVTVNPLALVPIYSKALVAAFGSHIELYQRHWNQTYEPYANTSVVYGYAYHRDAVRQLARRYATHLRYINHTLDGFSRFLKYSIDPKAHSVELESLAQDFNHFAREMGAMKLTCDQFLEQQVSKLALQDARTQMQEAKDLKRLSYLAFIFVPLSLTSSFFGMNVRELDSGPTPVWVFVMTALAILLGSIFFAWLFNSSVLPIVGRALASFFGDIWVELAGTRQTSKPSTLHAPAKPQKYSTSPLKPKKQRTWKFWKSTKTQYTQAQQVSARPPNPYLPPSPQYPGQQSAAPPHWTDLPSTYPDPYEPILAQTHYQPHSVDPSPLPAPPQQYLDRPAQSGWGSYYP